MRAKRTLGVLVALLALGLLPATVVLATHHPLVSDVVGVASNPLTYNMPCEGSAGQWNCDAYSLEGSPWALHAVIKPGSGELTSLRTDAWVSSTPLDQFFRGWMNDLHQTACVNDRFAAAAVSNFVTNVGSLTTPQSVSPLTITGECNLTGGLVFVPNTAGGPQWDYWMNANVIQPPPPSPTPSPTPAPTASPTPIPSPTATPTTGAIATPQPGTATPRPTATATATPSASASSSESASASASASASETESATSSATAEQSVAGLTFSSEPSVPQQAPEEGDDWAGSVPGAGDVSTDVAKVGGSAMAALLMLVAMGFIGELFNNTMETNYGRMTDWWKKSWVGRIGRGVSGLFGGGS